MKTIMVLGKLPETALELLDKIYRLRVMRQYDFAEIEIKVLANSHLGGRQVDAIVTDEEVHWPVQVPVHYPEPVEPHVETDHTARRSKGDRHRNKRYRWS